jgi:hypothetical protein
MPADGRTLSARTPRRSYACPTANACTRCRCPSSTRPLSLDPITQRGRVGRFKKEGQRGTFFPFIFTSFSCFSLRPFTLLSSHLQRLYLDTSTATTDNLGLSRRAAVMARRGRRREGAQERPRPQGGGGYGRRRRGRVDHRTCCQPPRTPSPPSMKTSASKSKGKGRGEKAVLYPLYPGKT